MISAYQLPLFEKICSTCHTSRPLHRFSVRQKSGALFTGCKDCAAKRVAAWYAVYPGGPKQHKIDCELLNPGTAKRQRIQYRQRNYDKLIAVDRAYKLAHKEEMKATRAAWREHNLDRHAATQHKRRFRLKDQGGTYTVDEWSALKAMYAYTCLKCGKKEPEIKLTFDHVDPFGRNDIHNCQPLCRPCNAGKKQRCIDYRSLGQHLIVNVPDTVVAKAQDIISEAH